MIIRRKFEMRKKIDAVLQNKNVPLQDLRMKGSKDEYTEIDMSVFEQKIISIRNVADSFIDTLVEPYRSDRHYLLHVLMIVRNHPRYKDFYDIIRKHFQTFTNPIPRTVGAWLAGCMVSTSYNGVGDSPVPACSILCAGAVPRPVEEGRSKCDNTSIFAYTENGSFRFFIVPGTNLTNAMIHVKYDTYDEFPGFSLAEKEALANDGVVNVMLVSYNDNYKEYYDLLGTPTTLDQIKTRPGPIISNIPPSNNTQQTARQHPNHDVNNNFDNNPENNWWWVLLVILIILIPLIVLYIVLRSKNKEEPKPASKPRYRRTSASSSSR